MWIAGASIFHFGERMKDDADFEDARRARRGLFQERGEERKSDMQMHDVEMRQDPNSKPSHQMFAAPPKPTLTLHFFYTSSLKSCSSTL